MDINKLFSEITSLNPLDYFYIDRKEEKAVCKKCSQPLSIPQSNTSTLYNHLSSNKHNIDLLLLKKKKEKNESSSQLKIDKFLNNNSLEARYARMAALNGFTFQSMANSQDLNDLLKITGYQPLKSASSIRNAVVKFGKSVISKLKCEINNYISKNIMVNVTVDEARLLTNKKYLNVNIHLEQGDQINTYLFIFYLTINLII